VIVRRIEQRAALEKATPPFRGGAKHQPRNIEIAGLELAHDGER
jgi:hypothetical protein